MNKHQARGATSSQGPATLSGQGFPRAEGPKLKGQKPALMEMKTQGAC